MEVLQEPTKTYNFGFLAKCSFSFQMLKFELAHLRRIFVLIVFIIFTVLVVCIIIVIDIVVNNVLVDAVKCNAVIYNWI